MSREEAGYSPFNIARRSAENYMAVPLYEHMHMHMAAQAGGAQAQEEQCLVEYIKNRNRSYDPVNRAAVTVTIINILHARQANNKRLGYRNCTKLSEHAKSHSGAEVGAPLLDPVPCCPSRFEHQKEGENLPESRIELYAGNGTKTHR